jgi:hypothetical protein
MSLCLRRITPNNTHKQFLAFLTEPFGDSIDASAKLVSEVGA